MQRAKVTALHILTDFITQIPSHTKKTKWFKIKYCYQTAHQRLPNRACLCVWYRHVCVLCIGQIMTIGCPLSLSVLLLEIGSLN